MNLLQAVRGKAIIVGEGNPDDRRNLESVLNYERFTIQAASDTGGLWNCLTSREPATVVIIPDFVPHKTAIDLLCEIQRNDDALPVIVISATSSPKNIVETMQCGATDVLVSPLDRDELRRALRDALAPRKGRAVRESLAPTVLFGSSPVMQQLMSVVHRVSASDAPVLIQGETGVGKEVLARHLHANSPRAGGPFVKINCAALPPELIESELFGHERGAFTGAIQNKTGIFERAKAGVILLDEIGDMDLRLQAKLLQVLQDQQFHRVGGTELVRVNVRIIAATHRDLESSTAKGDFRADLYYRLNVINLRVPPLRERPEDILPLVTLLLERHRRPAMPVPMISPAFKGALLAHNWPGNVRELENVVRKFLILGDPGLLEAELIGAWRGAQLRHGGELLVESPHAIVDCSKPASHGIEAGSDAEAEAIVAALDATRWNRKSAALLLGTGYKALLYKMRKHGIVDTEGPIVPSDRAVTVQRRYRAGSASV